MPGCGELLRQARLARGWSLEELHDKARISVSALTLIEEEKWSELPEDAILRGYVKRFAQFVGYDAIEIWAMIEAERGGQKLPQPTMVPSPRSPETGTVRLLTKEPSVEETFDTEATPTEDDETQGELKVIAMHILNEANASRSKRATIPSRPRRSTSVSAVGPDGQLPLINSRSEPGSRGKPTGDQLRPILTSNLLDKEVEVTEREEAKPIPETTTTKDAAKGESISAQIVQRSVVSFLEDSNVNAGITEIKRKQAVSMQRKRLLKVRRQRMLIIIIFWLVFFTVMTYILFFYGDGQIWQQILSSLSRA